MFWKKAVLSLVAAAAFFGVSAAKAETEFTFSSWIPWTHGLNVHLYIPWAEAVEKASNGEVKIRFLPKSVAAPRAYLDAVRTGQTDIGFGTHSYSPQLFAAYHFTDFPFLGDRSVVTSVALQRTHDKFFADKNLYDGVQLIGINTLGPGLLFHRTKLIKSPEDMVGQKIRTGGEITRRLVEGLGGVSVAQPITKAYELLSTGVVDGHAGHWEQLVGFKLTEVLPYATIIPGGLNSGSMYLMVNKAKYDSLSPVGKAAFDKYSGEVFAKMAGEAWDKINDEGEAAAKVAGTTIAEAPDVVIDAMKKISVEFGAEYYKEVAATNLDGKAILDYFSSQVDELKAK